MNRNPFTIYRWQLGLLLFLLVYDGAIRKWLFPGGEQIIFIVKDIFLVGVLWFWLIGRIGMPPAKLHPAVRILFALYAYWVVLRVVNTNSPNLMIGLWGLKSHLLYASLLIFVPFAFPSLDELFADFQKIYPWMVLPVCSLAFAQVIAPADSLLNAQLARELDQTAYFGDAGLVRVTGTFSYISGMAAFVQCTCLLGIALYLGGARSRLFLVSLAFDMAALPATGSRSVVAAVVVGAIAMLLSARAARAIQWGTVLRATAALVALTAASFFVQDTAWEAFAQRVQDNPQDQDRSVTAFTNAFYYMDVAGLTGFGTGTANLGAVALSGDVVPFSWLPIGDEFEEESGRIVIELGIVGWIFSLAMRVGLLIWAGSLARRGRTRVVRLAGVLALPIMALGVQQGSGVFAAPLAAVYYWFCVAVMAMAQYEDLQSQTSQTQSLKAQSQRRVAP